MRLLHSCLFLITPLSSVFDAYRGSIHNGLWLGRDALVTFLFLYLFCRLIASDGFLLHR